MPDPFSTEINYREHPEKYHYTPNEKGVFRVQPYKGELLPHWSFKSEQAAKQSADTIYQKYLEYRENGDFIGMDMARKYLRLGFTRAMRYAKYPGGQKYDDDGDERTAQQWADGDKRAAAIHFRDKWQMVLDDPAYEQARQKLKDRANESDSPNGN
jgi:hypothetical protein